jgi:hypothetical protein
MVRQSGVSEQNWRAPPPRRSPDELTPSDKAVVILTVSGLLLGFTALFSVLERPLNRDKQCVVGWYAIVLLILVLAQLVPTILAFRWHLAWWARSLALLALTASFVLARWWAFGDAVCD